jgi:hypothetical protein
LNAELEKAEKTKEDEIAKLKEELAKTKKEKEITQLNAELKIAEKTKQDEIAKLQEELARTKKEKEREDKITQLNAKLEKMQIDNARKGEIAQLQAELAATKVEKAKDIEIEKLKAVLAIQNKTKEAKAKEDEISKLTAELANAVKKNVKTQKIANQFNPQFSSANTQAAAGTRQGSGNDFEGFDDDIQSLGFGVAEEEEIPLCEDDANIIVIKFEYKKKLGIQFNAKDGEERHIKKGSQGEKKGIKKGWIMAKINDIPFSKKALVEQIKKKENFSITFYTSTLFKRPYELRLGWKIEHTHIKNELLSRIKIAKEFFSNSLISDYF